MKTSFSYFLSYIDSSITINLNGLMMTEIESVTYSIRFTNFQLTVSNTDYSMSESMTVSSGTDSYRVDFSGTSATNTILKTVPKYLQLPFSLILACNWN